MSKRGKGKKVAIVGFSKTSYDDVPWDNSRFEKWGLAWDLNGWRRYDRLFDRAIMVFKSTLPFSALQSMQYTVYYDKGHYDWHRDIGSGDEVMKARVNVGIVQLSNPSDYKGGVLQLKHKNEVIDVMKTRGMVTTFPIDMEHKVTPVTSGVRKTLIMWGLK